MTLKFDSQYQVERKKNGGEKYILAFSPELKFRNYHYLKELKGYSLVTMKKETKLLSHAVWVGFFVLHKLGLF